ncbi:cyclic nucleotide-binding domain-containing protein 1-like [Lineus longissimus]|uniref:cyclic nucleotide-binding domain-containing protein 1-like n=1 Tax=Lineus longissimus TaxID=88925 RepID=UPI002B4C58AC
MAGNEQVTIDYPQLRELCQIDGLKNRNNSATSDDAHRTFMNEYKKIFATKSNSRGNGKLPLKALSYKDTSSMTSLSSSRSVQGPTETQFGRSGVGKEKEKESDTQSHNISDWLGELHKQRKSEDPAEIRKQGIKTLRKVLRKISFERNANENDTIYQILKTFPLIHDHIPDNVLRELCVIAQLDVWKEPGITIFGNTGFHLILKGAVCPLSDVYLNFPTDSNGRITSPSSDLETPRKDEVKISELLGVGKCFGTLKKLEGREPNSRVLSAVTAEPVCEFLKITTSDYTKVIEQIETRDKTEKMNLLQSCENYKLWSRQPLLKVANLIEWTTFPANTVIVSEGYRSPFIAFIKSGECHVLRKVEIVHTLKNGKQKNKTKQVVIGKLQKSDSFGEISVLDDEPITCSLVTASTLELGVIEPTKLHEIDDVTVQLLRQSSKKTFGDANEDEIHEEYIQQELKREWNEFKHNVVVDVINSRAIRPGYGKWAK